MFVPFAVRQRRAGLVLDPAVRSMNVHDRWVPAGATVADKKSKYSVAAMVERVDRVIGVLTRFMYRWKKAFKARRAAAYEAMLRRAARIYAARAWTRKVLSSYWYDLVEVEDRARDEEEARIHKACVEMPADEWRAYQRIKLLSLRKGVDDAMPLLAKFHKVWVERQAVAAKKPRVSRWADAPVKAKVVVIVPKKKNANMWATLDDSDSD